MKILKKFIYFIIILSCFALFSSCRDREIKNVSTEIELSDENGGGTGILANNKTADFYFYYPENFSIQRNDDMIIVSSGESADVETDIQEPGSDDYFPILTRTSLSTTVFGLIAGKYETVDDYWGNYVLPAYEGMYQTIEILSEDDLVIDKDTENIPAKKYTYAVSLAGMKYKLSEVIFFRKQKVYTLTYTATENKYPTYVNVLNTAVDTFRFK